MPEQLRLHRRAAVMLAAALLGLGAALAGLVWQQTHRRGDGVAARVLGEKLTGGGGGAGDSGNGKNQGGGNDKKAFTIAGQVGDLYPGAVKPLVLTLTNQNNFPIKVTALSIAVASSGGCAASNLQVAPYTGAVVVPANGTATTSLDVRMVDDPPDACQSRTFGLTYSGTAVKP